MTQSINDLKAGALGSPAEEGERLRKVFAKKEEARTEEVVCEACREVGHEWADCELYGREAPCLGACPRCPRESHLPDQRPVVVDDRPAPPGRLILAQLASERGAAYRRKEQREILDLPEAEGTGSASSIKGGGDSDGTLPRQEIDVDATMAAYHRSEGKYMCCRCDGREGCRRGCASIG